MFLLVEFVAVSTAVVKTKIVRTTALFLFLLLGSTVGAGASGMRCVVDLPVYDPFGAEA
jgi:hypothetical protein